MFGGVLKYFCVTNELHVNFTPDMKLKNTIITERYQSHINVVVHHCVAIITPEHQTVQCF